MHSASVNANAHIYIDRHDLSHQTEIANDKEQNVWMRVQLKFRIRLIRGALLT